MKEINSSSRRPLTSAEERHLWMVSGGICSFEGCNERLVASSDGMLTNVGVKAHIIGHKKGAARHEDMEKYGYTQDTLEDISNLMLMCYHHSKVIDDKFTKSQFPTEKLFSMKEKHEKWIASRLQIHKKNSIGLIHKRLGPPINNIEYEGEAPYILLEAVEEQNEFIDFTSEGWKKGQEDNEKLLIKFRERLKQYSINTVEVFPLSPIPLLIHMGFLLTDTLALSIYQFDRERQIWVNKSVLEKQKNIIELKETMHINGEKELAILLSVSGTVRLNDVQETLTSKFDYIAFTVDNPSLDRVLYQDEIQTVQSKMKAAVELLVQEYDYEKIHLFYAGPAGLAINIGRGINPRMWGNVSLYQYDKRTHPRYNFAFSLC